MSEKANVIDPKEFAAAEREAEESMSVFVHKFRKPVCYDGVEYTEMTFDWDRLTGADGLEIEAELQALGKVVLVPAISGDYLARMAARACTTAKVGADIFRLMSLADYNRIRSAARSFLMQSES